MCSLTILSIIALLYNIPRFFEVEIMEVDAKDVPDVKINIIHQTNLRQCNVIYYWVYFIGFYMLVMYAIPLLLLSILNTKIYQAIKKANRDRSNLTRHQELELNVASMLVSLVAIFIACNGPAFFVNIFELLHKLDFVDDTYLTLMTTFSNFLVCFNSSVNFVVYCTFGKKFRERLLQTFVCCKRRGAPRRSPPIKIRNNHKTSIVAETIV